MKKAILVPDSFKGTLSSEEICSIMSGVIRRFYPDCEIISIPVAVSLSPMAARCPMAL